MIQRNLGRKFGHVYLDTSGHEMWSDSGHEQDEDNAADHLLDPGCYQATCQQLFIH